MLKSFLQSGRDQSVLPLNAKNREKVLNLVKVHEQRSGKNPNQVKARQKQNTTENNPEKP